MHFSYYRFQPPVLLFQTAHTCFVLQRNSAYMSQMAFFEEVWSWSHKKRREGIGCCDSVLYKTSLSVWLISYLAKPTRQTHTYTMTVCFGKTLYVSSTTNSHKLGRLHRLMLSCTTCYTTAPSTFLLYIMNTLMCAMYLTLIQDMVLKMDVWMSFDLLMFNVVLRDTWL